MDGSVEPLGGSGLHDGEFDVEVKLSDMQSDVHNPLYSVNTFEELGMYVVVEINAADILLT